MMKDITLKNKILLVFFNIYFFGTFFMYSLVQDTVPLDPGIRYGKLSNGLTYYIKPIKGSSPEMDVRLLVKAGSAVQDPDQYDIQHFVEHMAFKSGKHMTIAKANDLGFELGQINGGTSFGFTQYYFKYNKSKEKRHVAFELLQDIIWGLEFKDEYIDSERSVILNEYANRGTFNAGSIINSLESSMIGRATKPPKDIVEYIRTFPYEVPKRYYNDWYRTDLMAIMVVGDIEDADVIEKEIKEKFSRVKRVSNPRSPVKDYNAYRNSSPQFIRKEHPFLAEGSKNKAVHLRLYMRQNIKRKEHGVEVLENEQKRQLFIRMLRERFEVKQQQAYATSFYVLPEFIIPSSLGLALHIRVEDGSGKEVILQSMQLLRQIKANGFSKQEFLESKKEYLESLAKRDTAKVSYWADDILKHFVHGKVLPSHKKELLMEMMRKLTLTEFNRFIKQYIRTQHDDMDIIMLAPPGHQALSYSEKEVRGWIAEGNNSPVRPYSPPNVPDELMSPLTVQGLKESTLREKSVPIPGAVEYQLGNGVRVVLKPFDSVLVKKSKKRHKLRFRGFIPKGVSCYPKKDHYSALNSTEIVWNSGVGGLDKFELKRYFNNVGFSGYLSPYIDYDEAGIKGHITVRELETALQLVYLYFTAPNKDGLAFKDWKLRATSSLVLKDINEDVFRATIREIVGDYTIYSNDNLKKASETDMDRAFEIYRDIFGNAEDFTFVFTGDFPKNKVLSLCRKYLGNLPVKADKKKCEAPIKSKTNLMPKPRSITIPSMEYMQEVKARLVYVSKLGAKEDWKEEVKLNLLQSLMNFSMMQEIRFNSNKKEQTYFIGAYCNHSKSRLFNEVFIEFSSSPEDVEQLIMDAKQFVKSFKDRTIDTELFKSYIKTKLDYLEKEKRNIKLITEKMHDYYWCGRPWRSIEQEQKYIQSLTPDDIKNTAQQLLQGKPFEFKMVSPANTIQ